nr:MAG TPA: hypothetical protein [Caudoviricetes sp.]
MLALFSNLITPFCSVFVNCLYYNTSFVIVNTQIHIFGTFFVFSIVFVNFS